MKQIQRRFFAWLAETSLTISNWAVRQAYSHVQSRADAASKYGLEAYRQSAYEFRQEWQQYEPMTRCRDYGIEREKEYEQMAMDRAPF